MQIFYYCASIRDYDPLKQGLKHNSEHSSIILCHIRDYDPLKQGLKHSKYFAIYKSISYSRL